MIDPVTVIYAAYAIAVWLVAIRMLWAEYWRRQDMKNITETHVDTYKRELMRLIADSGSTGDD